MKNIYLDAAAATPLAPTVLRAMQPYFQKCYANPSSMHALGQKAREAVEESRKKVAAILKAQPSEIIFTSGGTESNNLAIQGVALARGKGHIITSSMEHPSVLEICKYLETTGFQVTYLPVNRFGLVSVQDVEKAVRKETILISIMYANNEIGTIQPIPEIGRLAKKRKILFHTDACQAGSLDLNVNTLGVDLLSLNGSKIYGPKGSGILYVKSRVTIQPLLHGGNQEQELRSGTENVPGIVGFAHALELIQKNRRQENKRLISLRDYFIKNVLTIPGTTLNGHPTQRTPNNINISFAGVDAETIVNYLSLEGIYISNGSACSSGTIEPSQVLKAIKAPHSRGSIRISLGKDTTKADLKLVYVVLKRIIGSLRKVE